jgi:hypothetical protein
MNRTCQVFIALVLSLVVTLFVPASALASHSWGNYHWARTSNPFTLQLGSNLTSAWVPYLNTTSYDWSLSSVLDTRIVSGSTTPRNCRATSGKIEICNSKYGTNGWLGIAQIWTYGDHIAQGVVKMNDSYFNMTRYNTPAWKNLVLCQEVGHTFGLDHQDETFDNTNLGSCMDYTNLPASNQHPNQHDYDHLSLIYTHLDTSNTVAYSSVPGIGMRENFDHPSDWGQQVKRGDKTAVFERHLGPGAKVFTFVVYAD